MSGIAIITAERVRQINEEGFSFEHDDQHTKGELAIAGASYAWPNPRPLDIKLQWPWHKAAWKPVQSFTTDRKVQCLNRIRELAKAGALIAAEIDRLQRLVDRG